MPRPGAHAYDGDREGARVNQIIHLLFLLLLEARSINARLAKILDVLGPAPRKAVSIRIVAGQPKEE